MEDTGEMVHILPQDHLNFGDDETESDLDHNHRGLSQRRAKGVKCIDDDGEEEEENDGSDLDRRGAVRRRKKEAMEETESDLDQAMSASSRVYPGKKSGKAGIMRRKGVSKSKGSPYRNSGSSHDDDVSPLIVSQSSFEEQRRNGEWWQPVQSLVAGPGYEQGL